MNDAFKRASLDVAAAIKKAILAALGDRDETADVCIDAKGRPEPDSELRDYENIPIKEDIASFFDREVKPQVPDAWIAGVDMRAGKAEIVDDSKIRVGFEVPVSRHFYTYKPLRSLGAIEMDIRELEGEVQGLLGELLR
jgi:type I restriction enzyme M protein